MYQLLYNLTFVVLCSYMQSSQTMYLVINSRYIRVNIFSILVPITSNLEVINYNDICIIWVYFKYIRAYKLLIFLVKWRCIIYNTVKVCLKFYCNQNKLNRNNWLLQNCWRVDLDVEQIEGDWLRNIRFYKKISDIWTPFFRFLYPLQPC